MTTSRATELLWTGGWDSTFRLLQLVLAEKRPVVPHYIIDTARPSSLCELRAMERIRARLLSRHPETKPLLGRTIIAEVSGIAAAPEITASYNRILTKYVIGLQYEWLARYAAEMGLDGLELAIHRDDKAHVVLQPFLSPLTSVHHGVYRIEPRFSGADEYALFGRFGFPLFDKRKTEMDESAADAGFSDIMTLTWFCFHPTGTGRACGVCNPCVYTIQEGLSRRVPLTGRIRYHLSVSWRIRQTLARYPKYYNLARTARRTWLPRLLRRLRSSQE